MARKKFTIRLSDKEKRQFTEYYQEHTDKDSLSSWLRTLAETKVDAPEEEDTSALDEALLRRIIKEETSELHNGISELAETVAELDEAVRTGDHITALAEDAYRILSGLEPEGLDDYAREVDGHTPQDIDIEWYVRNDGTVDAFAQYFRISEEEARRALIRCENMFPAVESRILDSGKRSWFRGDALDQNGMENVGDGV